MWQNSSNISLFPFRTLPATLVSTFLALSRHPSSPATLPRTDESARFLWLVSVSVPAPDSIAPISNWSPSSEICGSSNTALPYPFDPFMPHHRVYFTQPGERLNPFARPFIPAPPRPIPLQTSPFSLQTPIPSPPMEDRLLPARQNPASQPESQCLPQGHLIKTHSERDAKSDLVRSKTILQNAKRKINTVLKQLSLPTS